MEENGASAVSLNAVRELKLDCCFFLSRACCLLGRQLCITVNIFNVLVRNSGIRADLVLLHFCSLLIVGAEDRHSQEPATDSVAFLHRILHVDRLLGRLPQWVEGEIGVFLPDPKERGRTLS